MVQDLGLEDVGTIRTMAHWDSKKDLTGRAQWGWHDICSLSTHFSAALPKPQAGIRFPPYLCYGSLTNCVKKMGHGRHLEQGVCTFSYTFYALLGVTSNCRHKVLWFRSLSSLTSPAYGNVGLSSSTTANLKPSLYFSVPIITFQKLIHV
jgi:hypothetical protein